MHGLELFNSNGEKTFSSEYEYLKVLKMGKVTITSNLQTITVSLPAQKLKPKIWVGGIYHYWETSASVMYNWRVKPMAGNLGRDSSGNYYNFQIGMVESLDKVYSQSSLPPQPYTDLPWTIPYVVFI